MTPPHAWSDRNQLYTAVKAWMQRHRDDAASPITLKTYRTEWSRLVGERRATGESLRLLIARTGTDNDFCRAQAAIFWRSSRRLHRLMNRYRKARFDDDTTAPRLRLAIEETLQMLEEIEAMPELVKRGLRRRASRLHLLPDDWQEQLLLHANEGQQIALLFFSLTGARPSELRAGVRFRITFGPQGKTLELSFGGAKRSDQTGQKVRTLTLSVAGTEAGAEAGTQASKVEKLIAHLAGLKDTHQIDALQYAGLFTMKTKSLTWIASLARAIWPDLKVTPTPYSFRYAFRRREQGQGTAAVDQALAMGHQATRSAAAYGRAPAPTGKAAAGLQIKGSARPRQRQELKREIFKSASPKPIEREQSLQRDLFVRQAPMER